jgi:molybdopterin converting factor small subunit
VIFTAPRCGRNIRSGVEVRIRLGSGIARFARAPQLTLELPDGATVADLYERLAAGNPELAPALRSALPVVLGVHVERSRTLAHGEEVALLTPVAGG